MSYIMSTKFVKLELELVWKKTRPKMVPLWFKYGPDMVPLVENTLTFALSHVDSV